MIAEWSTTLAEALDEQAGLVVLTEPLPADVRWPFRVVLDHGSDLAELAYLTGRGADGLTYSIDRGVLGSDPSPHEAGAPIFRSYPTAPLGLVASSGEHPTKAQHVSLGLAESIHDHDSDYEPAGAIATHAATPHGGDAGPHTHTLPDLPADVVYDAELDDALSGKVDDTDPRLTDARTPAVHDHDADIDAAVDAHLSAASHDAAPDLSAYATDAELAAAIASHVTDEPHSEGGGSPLDAWPIGSVYIAVDATDPATRFGGGTWSAFAAGRMLVGLDAGDASFDVALETGGAKTHTHADHSDHAGQSHSGAAVANHTVTQPTASAESAHTHTYTQVPNHVHVQKVGSAATGGLSGYTADTSTNTPVNTGYSTDNPTGGVATGTTAGGTSHTHTMSGAAVDAHQVTQPSQHAAQSHSAHDAPSHLPPYITVYMWRRTA